MNNLQAEYHALLEEIKKAQQHANMICHQVDEQSKSYHDFENRFINCDISEQFSKGSAKLGSIKQELESALESELPKLELISDYEAICQERELVLSAGVHLALLMKQTGAKKADLLLTLMLHEDPEKMISNYHKRVKQLSEVAVYPKQFKKDFSMQKVPITDGENYVYYEKESGNRQLINKETMWFGRYPQSSNSTQENPIEWYVLERKGNQVLLLSKYALDAKQFSDMFHDDSWEKCTLREWLNNEFYDKAFSIKEKKAILTTLVDNSFSQSNAAWTYKSGQPTNDNVFLLSFMEIRQYLSKEEERKCEPTDYAISKGAYCHEGIGWWWLRSPGMDKGHASYVDRSGTRGSVGSYSKEGNVRPAIWVNLNKIDMQVVRKR